MLVNKKAFLNLANTHFCKTLLAVSASRGLPAQTRILDLLLTVLVWCGKSVKFDRVCRTFVELNLGSTHGTPSESDVAPVSLQSRTYSVRFGT